MHDVRKRYIEIKRHWEVLKNHYHNPTLNVETIDFLFKQIERQKLEIIRMERMYENTGAMFNRSNMRTRIEKLEEEINQKNKIIAEQKKYLDNLFGNEEDWLS